MSIDPINIGGVPNDGNGQDLRSGGQVINDNFAELDTRTKAAQAKAEQGVADAATARDAAAAAKAVADAAVPATALGDSVPQLINGTVPASQLPSFVDDVLEYPALADFPAAGETGKIYIAVNDGDSPTNPTRQYRWSGSAFVLIPASPGSTDQVPEGSTNQYFTAARVRSTTLAGLGALVNAAILASDTVMQAFAKLQGQLNAKLGKSEVATDSEKLGGQPASFYTAQMVGATATSAGKPGLAPAPAAGDQAKYLTGSGTYEEPIPGVFTKKWKSSPLSFAVGSNNLVTHNLGQKFKLAKLFIVLTTSVGGWPVGTRLELIPFMDAGGTTGSSYGLQLAASTETTVNAAVGNGGFVCLSTVGGGAVVLPSSGVLTLELYA